MEINALDMDYDQLNNTIRHSTKDIEIKNCIGQRFIAAGQCNRIITIDGTPGNALGAYLDGAKIYVNGNVQDAVGDTMNAGEIVVNGSAGDALGYAMRGGRIYIKGNAGYRTGIHMKQYGDKMPVIVVGGCVGSFAGEYLAGGIIVILGLHNDDKNDLIGNFTGTGMHGGKIYVRSEDFPYFLPEQVTCCEATSIQEIEEYIDAYALAFGEDREKLKASKYYCLTPNAKNPYKKMYVSN